MAELTHSADVIIIGAGIAGASVAAHLAASLRVVLVEMESQPGYHTTGRSAAVFAPSYGPEAVRALTRASRGFYDQPPQGFASEALLTPRQILMIARADQLAALESSIAAVATGTRVQRLDASGLRAHQPLLREGYATAGMLDCGGQDIDVAALHQGYLRLFRARGGVTRTKAAVEGLKREGNTWVVRTSGQDHMTAPVIVNAAGAWADQIGQLAGAENIGLVPKRRTAMVVAEPAGFTRRDAPITIDIDEEFYLKPDAGRLLISPADETPTDPCDAQPEEMDVAICADRIMTAFDLDIRRIENKWAGLRSFVSDKEPVIGFSWRVDGFFWMAGQGGYGIQSAPAAAEVAAALILGAEMPAVVTDTGFDPSQVSPNRLAVPA
ncbi:FAD-dependent oxidoreductase [Sulfitobacter sp. G21635-S1]|uniref:NAD(P)/FAD-dependent oxidoreductase n=1 Tax=Sulfitobacter sp. G21635-S1 TaxID=3014043 RepID=UPI0022AEB5FC|nr:FAD-dependent oxidoreductase [Sulfitobacter sp. G21635-S1]MCZ4254153.1 FAD-dependent oxidoreductase [Sulfitobacter sp. G21635-S1]